MQATGFLLDIPRVEVLINSSRLSSKLRVDIKLLPIKSVLERISGRHALSLCSSHGTCMLNVENLVPCNCIRCHILSQATSTKTQVVVVQVPPMAGLTALVYWSCSTSLHPLCFRSPGTHQMYCMHNCTDINHILRMLWQAWFTGSTVLCMSGSHDLDSRRHSQSTGPTMANQQLLGQASSLLPN